MAAKPMLVGSDAPPAANYLVFLNDGPRRDELADLCTAMGWRVRHLEPEPSCAPGQALHRVVEFLARPDSPRRSVFVGYGQMGLVALSAASRHPERVTAVVAIDVPFDHTVRSDVAKLSCPVMISPEDDPEDVVAALEWFLSKRAVPVDQGSDRPARIPAPTSGDHDALDAHEGVPLGVRRSARTIR